MRKILSIAICVMLLVGTVAFGCDGFIEIIRADATTITEYNTGDIIEFGWYPQSEVTDENVISELNSLAGDNANWTSYNYYSNSNEYADGQMKQSDYMRYTDIMYNNDKYRGVIFDLYRESSSTSDDTQQSKNGYYVGNVYWFKYEPIEWIVLNPETGLILCNVIIDSQAYNSYIIEYGTDYTLDEGTTIIPAYWGDPSKSYYSNNYEKSSIRKWLNGNFYIFGFSIDQQNNIQSTILDNSAYSEEDNVSKYTSGKTDDKIFLLSYKEVYDSNYLWSSDRLLTNGSDYAKCQGLYEWSGEAYWYLRTAGGCSCNAYAVVTYGDNVEASMTHDYTCGVRPALNLDLTIDILQTDVSETGKAKIDPQYENSDDKIDSNDEQLDEETKDSGNVAIIIIAVLAVIVVALIVVIIVMATKKKKKTTVPTNPTYPNNQGYQNYPNNRNYANNQGNPYYQQNPDNQNNQNNSNGPMNPPYGS